MTRTADGSRGLAVWTVLGSGLFAVLLGSPAVWLVREQLHVNCSMGQPGSEGADTWTCSDGVGYIGVAVVFGAMWLTAVVVGALVAALVRNERAVRAVLVLLAGGSTAWILGWTWYGSSELVQDDFAPLTAAEYWGIAVGPAAVVSGLGLTAALVSLLLSGAPARFAAAVAALALIVATVLQPGLSINTIPAVGLLAAAAMRTTARPRTRRS